MRSFVLLLFFASIAFGHFHCGKNWLRKSITRVITDSKRPSPIPRSIEKRGVTFNVVFGGQSDQAFQNAFLEATKVWEELLALTPTVTFNINADYDSLGQGVLGATSTYDLTDDIDNYISFLAPIVDNSYPGLIYPSLSMWRDNSVQRNPNTTLLDYLSGVKFATDAFSIIAQKPNMKAIGYPSLDTLFDPNDGNITFSTDFDFDFDPSDGIDNNKVDFHSVAVHELGHLLGFTSTVDILDSFGISINSYPNLLGLPLSPLDFYRGWSSNGFSGIANFQNFKRLIRQGVREHVLYMPDGSTAGQLSQGQNAYSSDPNDENYQASHWRNADETGIDIIGIMDPSLSSDETFGTSPADDLAFIALGYGVDPNVRPYLIAGALQLDQRTMEVYGYNFRPGSSSIECIINNAITVQGMPSNGWGRVVLDLPSKISAPGTVSCANGIGGNQSATVSYGLDNNAGVLIVSSWFLLSMLFILA